MNRRDLLRRLLKWFAASAGAGTLAGGAGLALVQPRASRLPPRFPDDETRPTSPTSERHVVVIGGGLAGLSAAIELARRRFQVTLVERAPHLGGKLGGWEIHALGETFPIDLGFQLFPAQAYNLNALLEEAGCARDLASASARAVRFADGTEERLGASTHLFPLNLASMALGSSALHMGDWLGRGPALDALLHYEQAQAFAHADDQAIDAYLTWGGAPTALVQRVLAPLAKLTLNRFERLSAAEALRFFHFHLTGNPEGLGYRYLTRSSMDAVVHPLRRLFESLGGTVRTGASVQRLVRDGNAVTHVVLEAPMADAATVHVGPGEVPTEGYHKAQLADGTPLFVARRAGRYVALDGRCTHMGCAVEPEPESRTGELRCPCHGGRFDGEGRVLSGPPKRPLRTVSVVENADGSLTLGGGDSPVAAEELGCDHCVVACDLRGMRALVEASQLREPAFEKQVAALGETEPYLVLRLWLDRPLRPDREPWYTVSGYRYIDSAALHSRFQQPYADWARKSGGSVVELHAHAIAPEALAPPEELQRRMVDELQLVFPELAGARVLHAEHQQHPGAPRRAPGDHALRPVTETPLANLFLAGEHIELGVPATGMEGAVVSGKLAANAVLDREGLKELEISSVPLKGPLA